MKKQDYSNHVRYYPPHHFIFYPLITILLFFTVRQVFREPDNQWIWVVLSALVLLLGWLSFMTRQHYALLCQNRIVRLELRFRYFVLTGKRLEPLEAKLSFGQLAAVRFASDEELAALIDEVIATNKSPKEIKKGIRNWLPDHMRV